MKRTAKREVTFHQAWATAQAWWRPLPFKLNYQWVEDRTFPDGLFSALDARTLQVNLQTLPSSPYLPVMLAEYMGHFYLWPDTSTFAGTLQLQSRSQLREQSHATADMALQYFLNLRIWHHLHGQGAPVVSALQRRSHKSSFPHWIARLCEYLWQLAPGDLVQQCAPRRALTELEESSAALAYRHFIPRPHGQRPRDHLLQQLNAFLSAGQPHFSISEGHGERKILTMTVDKPLGLRLQAPNQDAEHKPQNETVTPETTDLTLPETPHHLSPKTLQGLLPQHAPITLVAQSYREAAWPHLFRLQSPSAPPGSLPESAQHWQLGDPIQALNWSASLNQSPTLIPGITTQQHHRSPEHETSVPGSPPFSPRLSIYLDCSQSMPDPQQDISLIALMGFIWMLSAHRAGYSIEVVNWAENWQSTGYTRNTTRLEKALLRRPEGGTHFPLERLLQSPSTGVQLILSDLGWVKTLQAHKQNAPESLQQLNSVVPHTWCFVHLPFPAAIQQRTLQQLRNMLPRWHFFILNHPREVPHFERINPF